jgi:hypothetical protein
MTPENRAALAHVETLARGAPLPRHHRVALHFHPERSFRGSSVLAAIAEAGEYRSQFETGISAGSLTAFPGGARALWESRLFGGAYDRAAPSARPRYGALQALPCPRAGAPAGPTYGPAPRFGSSYFRVREAVLDRTTFCYPDSVFEPTAFGTADRFRLLDELQRSPPGDPLDRYVEAHVHGVVRVPVDIEALVLDPSFRGSEIERLAARLGCEVEWHAGYRAQATALSAEVVYRGEDVARLAMALARKAGGILTPAALGRALRSAEEGGAPLDLTLQKRVWHLLARFGAAPEGGGRQGGSAGEESPPSR